MVLDQLGDLFLGTTVLGAFDPLNEIAELCEREDLWLHVDAAWGGALLFSDKYKHRLNGIHRSIY